LKFETDFEVSYICLGFFFLVWVSTKVEAARRSALLFSLHIQYMSFPMYNYSSLIQIILNW